MTRTFISAIAVFAFSAGAALSCTAEDVQDRQDALLAAVQQLMAVDPTRAQAIVIQMQADLDTAAANNDDTAVCRIMDAALATATGN